MPESVSFRPSGLIVLCLSLNLLDSVVAKRQLVHPTNRFTIRQNYSLPKERRELCDLYEKQALVKPRDRTSTLPTPDAWKQSHDRSGAVCSERYAVLAGLKIYQISFFGTNTPPAFPDGQRKQR